MLELTSITCIGNCGADISGIFAVGNFVVLELFRRLKCPLIDKGGLGRISLFSIKSLLFVSGLETSRISLLSDNSCKHSIHSKNYILKIIIYFT